MSRKKWVVKSFDREKASEIAEELNISPYITLLTSTRGINTVQETRDFLGLGSTYCSDPMDFPDMFTAVNRIHSALDNFERIVVFGDYDADGVTATSLLYSYLEMQGANVAYSVPNRHTDGYGLSYAIVDKLSDMGAELIITVDNGISSVEEAEYIKELGMELIVTDHHLPGEVLPDAVAVVDPHRNDCILEFKDYAGVGVAYKLICALEGEENELTDSFLDLVAIGTIGDVMPLTHENREIVRNGTELINNTERPGIQALSAVSGLSEKTLTASSVAFGLVPRINAAGRMNTAENAIRLLLSDDIDDATELAQYINDENISRQQTEQDILVQAVEQINNNPQWLYDPVLVVSGEGWHDGVIGIVASRLLEKFGKPTLVITVNGENAKGSGRSIEGFNLYDALKNCSDTLTHFGGHTLAAGIGLKADLIEDFRIEINDYADSIQMPFITQNIDFKINPAVVNTELLEVISMLEPFGSGNPQPVFGLYNMTITDIQSMGNGKHLKIYLTRDTTTLIVVKFKMTQAEFPFVKGDVIDAAVTLEPNEYMGQLRLSIFLKNIKLHNMDEDILFGKIRDFSYLMRGGKLDFDIAGLLPERNVIVAVYKFIRNSGTWNYGNEMLCYRLNLGAEYYGKVCTAVEALLELGTVIRDENGGLTLPENSVKVNLDDAPIFMRIKTLTDISDNLFN